MKIAVIGLGKIGLPLAVQYASKGHTTIGLDVNHETVDLVNRGLEPFPEEVELQERLQTVVQKNILTATTDGVLAISDADVIVVAVPLFVDQNGNADFRVIDSVTALIGTSMKKDSLVCYETTLPIGTTKKRFTTKLEELSGKRVGEDFYVVFSPERVLTGRVFSDLRKYPKIVGGVTSECAIRGTDFYTDVLDFDDRLDLTKPNGVWNVGSAEAAEFVKLAETTYRDVNIGLANQFAKFANQISVDIQGIIEAANSQHYSHIHQPGISVGGHCIPIYPQFYLQNDPAATIVRSARKANWSMPKYFVDMLKSVDTNLENKRVLVLGVTYRPNVKEIAFSGAFAIKEHLIALGTRPYFDDPLLSAVELSAIDLDSSESQNDFDYAIVHTNHSIYQNFDFSRYPSIKYIIDGRGDLGKGLGLIKIRD